MPQYRWIVDTRLATGWYITFCVASLLVAFAIFTSLTSAHMATTIRFSPTMESVLFHMQQQCGDSEGEDETVDNDASYDLECTSPPDLTSPNDFILPLVCDSNGATTRTITSRSELCGILCAPERILVYALLAFNVLFVILIIIVVIG